MGSSQRVFLLQVQKRELSPHLVGPAGGSLEASLVEGDEGVGEPQESVSGQMWEDR